MGDLLIAVQVHNDPLQNGQRGSQPLLIMLGSIEHPHVFAQGVQEALVSFRARHRHVGAHLLATPLGAALPQTRSKDLASI